MNMKPEEFMMEPTLEEKKIKVLKEGIEGAKDVALGLLGKAVGLYKRASKGDPNPFLVGKAIAYLTSFQELAPVVGIKPHMYQATVKALWDRLGSLAQDVRENTKTTIVLHKKDERGLEIQQARLELDQKRAEQKEAKFKGGLIVEDNRPKPEVNERMIEDIVICLEKTMGYDRKDAERRARLVYKDGMSLEELIVAGCKV